MLVMNPVVSSLISEVGYNLNRQTLTIRFQNGSIRRYSGVFSGDFAELMSSKSKGRYFNRFIKGVFPSRKLQVIGQK